MDSYFDSPSGEVDDHFITGSSYESGNFGSTKVGVGFGI